MAKPLCTQEQFLQAWKDTGGRPKEVAAIIGGTSRAVFMWRAKLEKRGFKLVSSDHHSNRNAQARKRNTRRIELDIHDGTILIGSDAHIWPGDLTTMQRAFVAMARRVKPTVTVLNGDVFDGAKISRHPAGTWEQEKRPNVKQELEACQNFVGQVERASPSSRKIWTWGNHDSRIEYTLAALVPQYEGVPGFAMRDHFPGWEFCMAVFVGTILVIKHRHANGIHAAYNNTLKAGRSTATGHLHSPKYFPWTDYNGNRYGIDTGTLADPDGQQFDYMEEAPTSHRSACALLTIREGRLMLPEFCQVWDDGRVEFRGELLAV